jgi:long-chain acyl-CoA synthetase
VSARRLLFRSVHRALGGELAVIGCGGAPLDPKLATTWERMGVRVVEGYGLTETCAVTTLNTPRARRPGSVGRPVPGVDVRVAADGEILVRGPTVTPGYLDRPDLDAAALRDGWFATGDVGAIDRDGFLFVTGRASFTIVLPDGRNVHPEDVERVLNAHPLVRESCVVGVAGEHGEEVHAVLLTDAPERAPEVVRDSRRRLEAHQRIRSWTVWPEEDLPRTRTLKVDRARVRAAVERQREAAGLAPPAAARRTR